MIIYLTGPDTFRSRERLRQLREGFVKKYDPSGVNVTSFEGATLKFESFQESVASQGFLSSHRFVVVERPLEADRKTQEAIAEFIRSQSVPEETIVVFWSGDDPLMKRKKQDKEPTALASVLQRTKQKERFDELDAKEVEQWISRSVKERGRSIERTAAEKLASIVGSDLWLAANELEKLIHQKHGTITIADLEANLKEKPEANIFAFTDALSRKDARRAIALLEEQFDSGSHELYLLTMVARQIRILLSVGDIAKSEPHPATIASRLNLHPFVVRKALEQVRTFSQSELIKAHDAIVEIDRKIKTSRGDPRTLLGLFVLRFCGS